MPIPLLGYPIWRDYTVELAGDTSAIYTIKCAGEEIFSGKAYKRPEEDRIRIVINDICAPYLSQHLPKLGVEFVEIVTMKRTFEVFDEKGILIENIPFRFDWSFDPLYGGGLSLSATASVPIKGIVDRRQPLVASIYNANVVLATIENKDGSTYANEIYKGVATGNVILNLLHFPDAAFITVAGNRYEIIDTCARYALYYVNAYGGWDSLLIEGVARVSDNYIRQQYKQAYINDDPSNRGTVNGRNDYDKTFELVTGWLSDAESLRMHHLLGSTNVYLYDMVSSEMRPVILTDKNVEYKEFRTEGRMVNYTIRTTIAQDFVRR